MTTTTASTTPASTPHGGRDPHLAPWVAPDNVRAVLGRTRAISDGHITMSAYDHDGKETLAARKAIADLGDPLAWFMRTVESVVRVRAGHCEHLRVRVWERGGVGGAGAKFKAPDLMSIVVPASKPSLVSPASAPATRSAVRTEWRGPAAQTIARPAPQAMPRPAPSGAAEIEGLRREVSQLKQRCAAATERASRAEETLTEVQRRLRARDVRIVRLEERCVQLEAERDEAQEEVSTLSTSVQELVDAWES